MFNSISSKLKRFVGIMALAAFLCSPISYAVQTAAASAATPMYSSHDKGHRPPPPKHYKDKNKDKGHSDGAMVGAVLIGGVIGAVIAKNT